ncbi:MAG: helix-turn-helix domain-containing protein [Okeania sp. SIO3I5]|uniref:helix-turn-helix domain-containing protein n=1 Tax=Okeania sp. SIO3I5 TaxID=2607805 RepID=UPI0013B9C02A|nr:helix-turn-helix domain-containing protein [Okeania sp. SIO3I5]NEQ35732.1 helix-turn-helix domain-containing protein [Okeania sp. SIO3I5]
MPAQDQPFSEAAEYWDLKTLYADMASAKGRHLTPTEKLHLRGLLSGYSPGEIAEKLHKNANGVEVALCNTLYQYVRILVGKQEDKIQNWRNICEWLEEAGYKSQLPLEPESDDYLSAKLLIKKANVALNKNQIVVDINLRIVAESPIEFPIAQNIKYHSEEEQ